MFKDVDPLLLASGVARIGIWLAIAIIGYRRRRVLPFTFGAAAAVTSVTFAISNAHGHVPGILTDASTFAALPIAALILAGVVLTAPMERVRGHWWF